MFNWRAVNIRVKSTDSGTTSINIHQIVPERRRDCQVVFGIQEVRLGSIKVWEEEMMISDGARRLCKKDGTVQEEAPSCNPTRINQVELCRMGRRG